jgi:hypothetical protein
MGMYLSHLGNRKPDLVARVYPDENYAREVMQLFSIGLWMLNPDGSRQLNAQNQPISTYNEFEHHRVCPGLHGLAFGGTNQNFGLYPRDFTVPMKGWDAEHDCDPKTLLLGGTLPAAHPVRETRAPLRWRMLRRDRQPIQSPECRSVHRAPADPASGHLESESRLHRQSIGGLCQQWRGRARRHESSDQSDPARSGGSRSREAK